jgi:hypothetical protein
MVKYAEEELNRKNLKITSRLNRTFGGNSNVDHRKPNYGGSNDRRLHKNVTLTKKNDARFKIIQKNSNKRPTSNNPRTNLLNRQKFEALKKKVQAQPTQSMTREQRLFKVVSF